ncbi:trypsin-like peptidase domain-containing protein [Candidatus Pacearchaeota archaeon]|nr:trypsin-like peptidase domain-containing protein [Candidatus Pacearchaeota archaeon]
MKKHHKIIIGSATFLIIGFMVLSSIFVYMIFTKLDANYIEFTGKITDTQKELNDLADSLNSIGSKINLTESNLSNLESNFENLKSNSDFSKIIGNSMKSVVMIKTGGSQGSGFFIADGGYIITNTHIISGMDTMSIQIKTYDERVYTFFNHTASKIGDNEAMDISLLKIESDSYIPLKLGDSEGVQIGENVVAIGNPFGLEFSVSQGIVSAINKKIEGYPGEYIQTDTALNPGNSGGPLLDLKGDIIGINNFKISGGENLGFALESNYLEKIVNKIAIRKLSYKLL